MNYYVISNHQYGSMELIEFTNKEEALKCVAVNSGEDSYCRLIEGKELLFKITQIAEEIKEE